MSRLRISLLVLGAALASLTALATTASASSHHKYAVSGNLSWVGIWSGAEQTHFQAVLTAFQKKFPGVKVKYTSAGDNVPTVLSTAVAGGNPPDLASIGQPGLVKQFA
ncbi:MAG: alpha-glucoside transport system substrate-binding protein, partial [Gaiellales bacterium]|nr:alpha-glucoside transport system substrate-binding protein [Gaiellales bacterium]